MPSSYYTNEYELIRPLIKYKKKNIFFLNYFYKGRKVNKIVI